MNAHTALQTLGHFINGAPVADTARTQPVFNPATGQIVRQVALASEATVETAIAAAAAAFPAWRDTPPLKRARIMFRFKELLEENASRIVALITEEHGKVLDDALGELQRGIEVVEYACAAPEFLKGEHAKNVGPAIILVLFSGVVTLLGSAFYGILTLLTLPFASLFIVHMYRQFNGEKVV